MHEPRVCLKRVYVDSVDASNDESSCKAAYQRCVED